MGEDENITVFLKALGHPTRLSMVRELLEGERCVSEVENRLHISQVNASQHLSVLKASGIVDCTRRGNSRCYYLKDPDFMRSLFVLLGKNKTWKG
ncbi:MAG: ArsR/SmtB family transcription factor [Desulfomonilia bacterium]